MHAAKEGGCERLFHFLGIPVCSQFLELVVDGRHEAGANLVEDAEVENGKCDEGRAGDGVLRDDLYGIGRGVRFIPGGRRVVVVV